MKTLVTLVDIKNQLESAIIHIDNAIASETKLHKSYEDLMENIKASELGGLKRPNLFPYIQELNLQKQILMTLKFHVECQIEDNEKIVEKKVIR